MLTTIICARRLPSVGAAFSNAAPSATGITAAALGSAHPSCAGAVRAPIVRP